MLFTKLDTKFVTTEPGEVETLPRTPPLVVYDSSFLGLLAMESESLILGQYLANDYPRINSLDLHTALMRYVLAQNLTKGTPNVSFAEIVSGVMGGSTDVAKYKGNPAFQRQVQTLFLNSIEFLDFHEFCHINNGDPARRTKIAEMPDNTVPGAPPEATPLQLEIGADACAINIINRDEAQYKFSPISFFSVFMVASTQAVFEKFLPPHAAATHPSPRQRLASAYQTNLKFIEDLPTWLDTRTRLTGYTNISTASYRIRQPIFEALLIPAPRRCLVDHG